MNKLKQFLRFNAWILMLDMVSFCLSYLAALYIRMYINGVWRFGAYYQDYFWQFIPIYIAASVVVFFCFRLYGGIWEYAGLSDLNRIISANLVTVFLHVGISVLIIRLNPDETDLVRRMPVAYYPIGAVIQLLLTTLLRFTNRFYQEEKRKLSQRNAINAMIVGTGETSRIVRRQLSDDQNSGVRIACIFTYKPYEMGTLINGIPVVGNLDLLKNHISDYHVRRVILADSIMPIAVREKVVSICGETGTEIQNFSGFLRYDNGGLSFRSLMECVNGTVTVLREGKATRFDNGEQAMMAMPGRYDVRAVSVQEDSLLVELISYKAKPLIVFFITNRPDVALVAEKYGVDRIWIDLETRGKEARQHNMNTVKSNHCIEDIRKIRPLLTRSDLMVRVNSWYDGSRSEIDQVIAAGADIVMLPYWKTPDEVSQFLSAVRGRCKTSLLLETKEAVECVDEVISMGGFDEIHIGLNDLHLSYGMSFMFEPLANGIVEKLCKKFKAAGIPYGFGGIAKLGDGMLPAEKIIMEHYRLGSTRAILSRSFCDTSKITDIEEIDRIFRENMVTLREYEISMADVTQEQFIRNKVEIDKTVGEIAERVFRARSNGI